MCLVSTVIPKHGQYRTNPLKYFPAIRLLFSRKCFRNFSVGWQTPFSHALHCSDSPKRYPPH